MYKKMYLDRLWTVISGRIEDLKQGRVAPEQYMVPGRTGAARKPEGARAQDVPGQRDG